jgi:hypothetical protein
MNFIILKSVIEAAERLINTPIEIEINTENVKVSVFEINQNETNNRTKIGVQLGKMKFKKPIYLFKDFDLI